MNNLHASAERLASATATAKTKHLGATASLLNVEQASSYLRKQLGVLASFLDEELPAADSVRECFHQVAYAISNLMDLVYPHLSEVRQLADALEEVEEAKAALR